MSWGPAHWAPLGGHGEELPGLGHLREDSGRPSICSRAFANRGGRPAGGWASGRPWNCTPWRGAGGGVGAGSGGQGYPQSALVEPQGPHFLLSPHVSPSCGFPDVDLWLGDGMLGSGPPDPGPCLAVAAAFIWGSEGCPTRTTPVPSLARKDLPACSWHRSRSCGEGTGVGTLPLGPLSLPPHTAHSGQHAAPLTRLGVQGEHPWLPPQALTATQAQRYPHWGSPGHTREAAPTPGEAVDPPDLTGPCPCGHGACVHLDRR